MASLVIKVSALGAFLSCALGCAKTASETVVPLMARREVAASPPFSAREVAAAQRVTADALYIIYSQNLFLGATPDQRFYDRPLLVSGVYNGVREGVTQRTYLELRTHDDEAFTYAELAPRASSLLATLAPGKRVSLLCRGNGVAAGSPLLRDCQPQ